MLRWTTIAVSLAELPIILPRVVEDLREGVAQRVGLSTPATACLLGLMIAVQMGGLVLVGQDRRAGWVITVAASALWTFVAVLDHGPAVVRGGFRSGAPSVVWVAGLVMSQGVTTVLAWCGWRTER